VRVLRLGNLEHRLGCFYTCSAGPTMS
jgi:hypothetical protein